MEYKNILVILTTKTRTKKIMTKNININEIY